MATKIYPYRGESPGIKDFDKSLTVQSELEGTKLGNILHKFQVTGVLPDTGRVALPADTFFGGEDFQSLQNKMTEARMNGLDESSFEENNSDEHESGDAHTDDSEHGSEGRVATPADEQHGQQE